MFERYSDQARRAVELAEVEARQLGHGHLGTEHLLLGIVAEGQSAPARALMAAGATLQGCRELVAEAVGDEPRLGTSEELRLTDRANRALERAARLARRRRDPLVETGHVLVSVLDVEGRAGQVLRGLAVDLVALRKAVEPGGEDASVAAEEVMPAETKAPPAPVPAPAAVRAAVPAPAAVPVQARCARCEAGLEGSLAYQIISASADGAPAKRFTVAYCAACGTAVSALPQ